MCVWPPSSDVHAHQVPAGRAALAGAAPAPLEGVVVEVGGGHVAHAEIGADDVVDAAARLRRPPPPAPPPTGATTTGGRGPAPSPATAPVPVRPRPRPPRRRRRFVPGVAGCASRCRRCRPALPPLLRRRGAGRVSPMRGLRRRRELPDRDRRCGRRVDRRSARVVGPGASSPASSSATSATSSVVSPRSARRRCSRAARDSSSRRVVGVVGAGVVPSGSGGPLVDVVDVAGVVEARRRLRTRRRRRRPRRACAAGCAAASDRDADVGEASPVGRAAPHRGAPSPGLRCPGQDRAASVRAWRGGDIAGVGRLGVGLGTSAGSEAIDCLRGRLVGHRFLLS